MLLGFLLMNHCVKMLLQGIEILETDIAVAAAEVRRVLLALKMGREGGTAAEDLFAVAAGAVSHPSLVLGQELLVHESSGASRALFLVGEGDMVLVDAHRS
jgi:hypothetical protein